MDELARLLQEQDGVVGRAQALAAGATRTSIARALRRREWVAVHPGVYVDHTGPLAWQQRAWAAVLACGPAALYGESARRAHEGPGRRDADDAVIHVAVDRDRRVTEPSGARIHRVAGFADRVQWNLGPPRIRYDDTILDLASQARDDLAAIAVLADACGARRTTAGRLLGRLDERARVPRRAFLRGVLADVAEGTCSVLEHGYLTRVERPHGLPAGERQAVRVTNGTRAYLDVRYASLGLVVELDGWLFHGSAAAHDRDLQRDLDTAAREAGTTLRLGFGQVLARGCATALAVAAVMQRLGWDGAPTPCPQCGVLDEAG
ncbi:MAG TPA: type IV toxin-antitoxin system AbiEi family antitoxin domain-containing protein [Nocardioides sp.]|nr:type IV toxin-antitoxin system AbiEi family antitoxin domain-containing protein [Nocardioides sp.]